MIAASKILIKVWFTEDTRVVFHIIISKIKKRTQSFRHLIRRILRTGRGIKAINQKESIPEAMEDIIMVDGTFLPLSLTKPH